MKLRSRTAWLLCVVSCSAAAQSIDPRTGDPATIDPAHPPEHAQVVQLFLENAATPLSEHPACLGAPQIAAKLTLREILAAVLGYGLEREPKQRAVLRGGCEPGSHTDPSGKTTEGWTCSLHVLEMDKRGALHPGGFVSGTFTKDQWRLLPGSLMCL
ncbi:hypothetical protein M8A51_23985 [Schlegelella sp. S2-27]|uniref:DUF2147 domain-containing protein n=1 Tax=Caldimonas mangrovi TaxID=2944811 RepID=A0ABT0YVH6_9BURK|nr:hypothetical protein [Caldimonas mangrovi]MCM5682603.1 hypothetical protein [Caldimonas mangrovi]